MKRAADRPQDRGHLELLVAAREEIERAGPLKSAGDALAFSFTETLPPSGARALALRVDLIVEVVTYHAKLSSADSGRVPESPWGHSRCRGSGRAFAQRVGDRVLHRHLLAPVPCGLKRYFVQPRTNGADGSVIPSDARQ